MTMFTSATYQNEYLAAGATHVDALVSITASGSGAAATTSVAAAEILIIDVSGSMNYPKSKIRAAVSATVAAIECIRDGVLFGVLAGADRPVQIYPAVGDLAVASPATRAEAQGAARRLRAA